MHREIIFRYSKKASRFFKSHEDIREQFKQDFRRVAENDHPERVDYKRMKGKYSRYYRIRIGNYRVIFSFISGQAVIVDVVSAGARGDVYKKI